MLYIKRGKEGNIEAISHVEQNGFVEVEENSSEAMAYLQSLQTDEVIEFLQTDMEFIRVIEDVIDVLIDKNLITITDFHPAVIEKLLKRKSIRKSLSDFSGMDLSEDNDTL